MLFVLILESGTWVKHARATYATISQHGATTLTTAAGAAQAPAQALRLLLESPSSELDATMLRRYTISFLGWATW